MTDPDAKDPPKKPSEAAGYIQAAGKGFDELTQRVQEMHQAIGAKPYDVLTKIPGIAGPSKLIQGASGAIADGVYAAVRLGGQVATKAAELVEQQAAAKAAAEAETEAAPGAKATAGSAIRAALNAAFGDHLAADGNPLAVEMTLRCDGRAIELAPASIAAALAPATGKAAVFIHGLGCDEACWHYYAETAWDPPGPDYPGLIRAEFGFTPVYLRYNTGLPVMDNGRRACGLIARLAEAWPVPLTDLVLIGHSMGGLIARAAVHEAHRDGLPWLKRLSQVICLGSPHRGSPVEKLGQLVTLALEAFDATKPLGKIAQARSVGIKDLRHGLRDEDDWTLDLPAVPGLPYRFVAANLAGDPDHAAGHVVGDGLVTLSSATIPGLKGDVEAVRLGGLGHMALLNEPRVWDQIRQWLGPKALSTGQG